MSLARRLAEAKYASALAEDAVWRRASDSSERPARILPSDQTAAGEVGGLRLNTAAEQIRLRSSDVDAAGGPPREGDSFAFSGRTVFVFGIPRPWGGRGIEWICEVGA